MLWKIEEYLHQSPKPKIVQCRICQVIHVELILLNREMDANADILAL